MERYFTRSLRSTGALWLASTSQIQIVETKFLKQYRSRSALTTSTCSYFQMTNVRACWTNMVLHNVWTYQIILGMSREGLISNSSCNKTNWRFHSSIVQNIDLLQNSQVVLQVLNLRPSLIKLASDYWYLTTMSTLEKRKQTRLSRRKLL